MFQTFGKGVRSIEFKYSLEGSRKPILNRKKSEKPLLFKRPRRNLNWMIGNTRVY